jgi:16S rRNA processing protein RimM
MERVVARLGRAHGLNGEISADLRTDVPQQRFRPGVVFGTEPAEAGPLTLVGSREHNGALLVRFDEAADRTSAERLRGVRLLVEVPTSDEPDAWYPDELVGLPVVTPDGRGLGTVTELRTAGAQDLLVVRSAAGAEILVPFVAALVPVVDPAGGRIVVDPPGGLFDDDGSSDDEPLH